MSRNPTDMADACLSSWSTPSESGETVGRRKCAGCRSVQCTECARLDAPKITAALRRRYEAASIPSEGSL